MSTVWIGNDNLLVLDGLQDEASGDYLNGASVSAVLVDESGTQVQGQTWPLSLAYVTGSQGRYQGVLEDTLALQHGQRYIAQVTADAAGLRGYWEVPVTARRRSR